MTQDYFIVTTITDFRNLLTHDAVQRQGEVFRLMRILPSGSALVHSMTDHSISLLSDLRTRTFRLPDHDGPPDLVRVVRCLAFDSQQEAEAALERHLATNP